VKKVNWLDLAPDEFVDRRAECPICYMPYGLAEGHGVYNYMGTDWYTASKVCASAAEKGGGIVAPHFAWHIDEAPEFNWSVRGCGMGEFIGAAIPPFMFFHNILYHLRAFDARGFKAALLVTGHAVPGAAHDVNLMIDYYKRKTGSPIQAEYFCYFELFPEDAFPGIDQGHASDMETALSYAANPTFAPMHLLGTETRYPDIGGGNERRSAYNAPLRFQNKAGRGEELCKLGNEAFEMLSDILAAKAKKLLDAYVEPKDRPGVPNYYELEEIWASFEQITSRYWKTNLTWEEHTEKRKHPDFPGWDWFI
jgi:creatinine amidohydrolase/Fe(II)-dependent formamide hydrolase-like protein